MTVYVDDMLRPAIVKNGPRQVRARWSHMLADTHQQLLDMASELGLRPEWIQREGTPHEHFDLTEPKRIQALGFGAVAIRYPHGTAQIIRAKREAAPTQTPLPSRLRSDAGSTPTEPPTPAQESTTRNLASPAGQGFDPSPELEDAIPPVVLDPRHARDCLCDPTHLEAGGYDKWCPRHDEEMGRV